MFYKIVLPVIVGVMSITSSIGQIEVGNGSVGCDYNNGVDPITIPTDYPMGVAVNNGDIIWTEINCPKLAIKEGGMQTVISEDITLIDVASDPWSDFTVALSNDEKLYEIDLDAGTAVFLTNAVAGSVQVKIAEGIVYERDAAGDMYKGGIPHLMNLEANNFDVRSFFGNLFTVAISDTDLYQYQHTASSPISLTPITNGEHVGINTNTEEIIWIEQSGLMRKWDDAIYELGGGYNNVEDMEVLDNGTAVISRGNVVETVPTSGGTLPVRLKSFDVHQDNTAVVLDWVTASEVNNDYFIVQRLNEDGQPEDIDRVKGVGNSTTDQSYRFVDRGIQKNGKYTYQLKQVDINGKFKIHPKREIKVTGLDITFGPNPTDHTLHVNGEDIQSVSLFDMTGRLRKSFNNANDNVDRALDVSDQQPGNYVMRIQTSGTVLAHKLQIN